MKNWKAPHWLMLAGATFGGAALGYAKAAVLTHTPATLADWESVVIGGVGTGAAAVIAIYIPQPVKTAGGAA